MHKILAILAFAGAVYGQKSAADSGDPLGRQTPQSAMIRFLEACHARDYTRATKYLDLRNIIGADRVRTGEAVARDLEDLLDDYAVRYCVAEQGSGGRRVGRAARRFRAPGHVPCGRAEAGTCSWSARNCGRELNAWLVSAQSVTLIPTAHHLVAETPFEKKLPQALVTFEVLDTPVWRWMALVPMGVALWFAAGFVSRGLVAMVRPLMEMRGVRGPLRVCLTVAGFREAMEFAPPSSLPRLFIERAMTPDIFTGAGVGRRRRRSIWRRSTGMRE